MKLKEKELDNIELRSERVRNVLGKVPPRLVSLGTVIITVIVVTLAVAFYKIQYPISIEANGEVVNNRTIQILVPYKYLYLFNEPRTTYISFEGNDDISYQIVVIIHSTKLVHKEDGNYFRAIGIMNTYERTAPVLQKHQKANIRIVISNKTLWQQVFETFFAYCKKQKQAEVRLLPYRYLYPIGKLQFLEIL